MKDASWNMKRKGREEMRSEEKRRQVKKEKNEGGRNKRRKETKNKETDSIGNQQEWNVVWEELEKEGRKRGESGDSSLK